MTVKAITSSNINDKKKLTVILIIVVIVVITTLGLIGIINHKPSEEEETKRRCDDITNIVKKLGVQNFNYCISPQCNNPLIYKSVGLNLNNPDVAGCPTGYKETTNIIGCCERDLEGGDKSFDIMIHNFMHNNPILSHLILGLLLKKITTSTLDAAKLVIEGIGRLGTEGLERMGATRVAGAVRAAGGALESGTEALARVGARSAEKVIGGISKRLTENVVGEAVSSYAKMLSKFAVPGPGWLQLALTMILDAWDPENFHQYMDNQLAVMTKRDQLEGAFIQAKKIKKNNIEKASPPYLFTLDLIFLYLPVKPTESDTDKLNIWKDFYILAQAWKKAHNDYINICLKKAIGEINDDDLTKVCNFFNEIIQSEDTTHQYEDIHLPNDIIQKITRYINVDVIDRDNHIIKYLKQSTINIKDPITKQNKLFEWYKYRRYLLHDDSGVMAQYGSTITISKEAKDKWNLISVNSTNQIFIVNTKYYRDVKSSRQGTASDKYPAQDLPHKDYSRTANNVQDLTGKTLYELETKLLPKEWMLVSPLKHIQQICKTGIHVPSMVESLITIADMKFCEQTGENTYIPGECTNSRYTDQPSCVTNDDPQLKNVRSTRVKRITKDNKNITPGLYNSSKCCKTSTYVPGQCKAIRNGQLVTLNENKLNCELKIGGTWHEGTCENDGTAHSRSQRFIQETIDWAGTKSDGHDNPLLNVQDISPEKYNVDFNEDTGICNFTEQYCTRFGRDFESVPHQSLAPGQGLTRCYETATTEFISFLVSETVALELARVTNHAREVETQIEMKIGDELEHLGISGMAGDQPGSFAYAMDHPFERVGNALGLEDGGEAVDKFIYDSGGLTTWSGNPVVSVITFPARLGITAVGRGIDAIFD